MKDIENDKYEVFGIEILMNQRLLKSFYKPKYEISEKESNSEEKRETWLKEKIYRIKENMLYNNLNNKFLNNVSVANIYYFKNYFKISEDFDSVNYDHLQKMRCNYLSLCLNNVLKSQNKTMIEKNKGVNLSLFDDFLNQEIANPSDHNNIISIISSIFSILYCSVKEHEILQRVINNLLFEIKKFDWKKNLTFDVLKEIENNLLNLFDVIDIKILKQEDIIDKIKASLLDKFLNISMEFESICLYLKTICKIRQFGYSFSNLHFINKFFTNQTKSNISIPLNKHSFNKISFVSNTDIKLFEFVVDEKFIYILIANKGIFKIGTGYLGTLTNTVYLEYLNPSISFGNIIATKKSLFILNSKGKELNLFNHDKEKLEKVSDMKINTNNKVLSIFSADSVFYVFEEKVIQRIEEKIENIDTKNIIIIRKVYPFEKEKEHNITFKNEKNQALLIDILQKNLPYLYFDKKLILIDYKAKKQYNINMRVNSLNKFKVREIQLNDTDLITSIKIFYQITQNVVFTSTQKDKSIIFDLCYNKLSSPYNSFQRYNKIFKNEILKEHLSIVTKHDTIKNKIKFLLTSKEKEIIFSVNYDESEKYFLFLLSNLVKIILIKGNSSRNFKKYLKTNEMTDTLRVILKKSLHNDISQNLINFVYKESITAFFNNEKKMDINSLKEVYSMMIILRNMLLMLKEYSIDFKIFDDENDNGFNYKSLTDFLTKFVESEVFDQFEKEQNISFIKEYSLLKHELISESIKILNILVSQLDNSKINLVDIIFEMINKNPGKFCLKIELLKILLSNYDKITGKDDILDKIINEVFKLESQILINLDENKIKQILDKNYLIFNENFKSFFIKSLFSKLNDWNFNDVNNPLTIIFKYSLDSLIEIINSYLKEDNFKVFQIILLKNETNKSVFLNYIDNHSIIFQITLLLIQMIINNNQTHLKEFPFEYFGIIVNVIIKLDDFSKMVLRVISEEHKTKENHTTNDKYYIFRTEHPCENDIKRSVNFNFLNKNHVFCQFDCLSAMNSESSLNISNYNKNEKNPLSTVNYSDNIPLSKFNLNHEKIVLNYNPKSKAKSTTYGFKIKLSSIEENYGIFSNNDIITDIRRSLIYSICKIIFHLFDSTEEKEAKKDKFLYKSIFNSKLLENISLSENLNISLFHDKVFKSVFKYLNETLQKKLNDLFFEYNCESKSNIDETIDETISSILNNKDPFFEKGIRYLQKLFIMKNVWGNMGGKEVEMLVIYVFCILIKHQNMLNRYVSLLNNINSSNEEFKIEDLHNLTDFNLFLKIWTESSKLRIWLNEKKMLIAENIESKKEEILNNKYKQILNDDILIQLSKEIDEEISMLFINISKKTEFILKTIRPSNNSLLNKEIIDHRDQAIFNDICENLQIYLKTDEINLEKIILKIKSQNDKALKKETSFIALNFLLYIINNEQDQKDILHWVNIIQRKKKRIISFVDDLYGAEYRIIDKVKNQFHIFIKILIEKCLKDNTSIFTYVNLIQSLVWKIKGRDFEFLKNVKFFELFDSHSNLSKLLITNNYFGKNKYYYGKEHYDLSYLQKSFFDLFQIYSLQIVKKLNEYKIESIDRRATSSSSSLFEFSRQVSLIDDNGISAMLINILQIITKEIKFYIEKNNKFFNNSGESLPYNEEKINYYFILLYRLLTNNHDLTILLISYSPELLSSLFELFLLCSDKNKYILLKLIHTIIKENDPKCSEILNISFTIFRTILKDRYPKIYNFMDIDHLLKNKENDVEFFVHYLFKLVILFQSANRDIIWRSDSDYELSWEIIDLIRNLLLFDTLKLEIMKFIKNALENNLESEKNIVFILLGVNFNIIKVGSTVNIRLKINTENMANLYDINEFINYKEKNFIKKGTILGFTNNPKNPFVIDDIATEFCYQQLTYNPKNKFALIVLEENISKETIKNSSYDCILTETEGLIPEEDNLLNDENIISVIKETNLINYCLKELINNEIPMQKKYYSLKLIKNIINSQSTNIKEHFFEKVNENQILRDLIKSLEKLSLYNLESRMKKEPFEILERNSINDLLYQPIKKDYSSKPSSNSLLISLEYKSIFLKYNQTLIKEIPFLKVYNVETVKLIVNKYLDIMKYKLGEVKNITDSIFMLVPDSFLLPLEDSVINEFNNRKNCLIICDEKLIIDENFNNLFNSNKINFAVICLSTPDFNSLNNFVFETTSSPDFENLFLQSIQRDFSSLIEIPPVMVDDSVKFGQRDLVLKIVGEEKSSNTISKEINNSNQDSIGKLSSLISRRILFKLLVDFTECCRDIIDLEKFLKIFKLLIFENNILTISNCTYYELHNDIISFIKKLDQNIEFDNLIINKLVNLEFLNKLNYIDYNILENVDLEEELLLFENTENDLKIIYALISYKSVKNLKIKDFEIKLFYGLTNKLNDFLIKSPATGEFVIDVLNTLLSNIYKMVENNDEYMITTISNYSVFFTSDDFTNLLNKIKPNIYELSPNKDNNTIIERIDSKLIKFFVLFIDLALKIYIEYDIDLNIKNFFEHKIFVLYYSYCLLTKKFNNLCFFILFCEKEDYVQINNGLSIKIPLEYTCDVPHLRKFSFPDVDRLYVSLNDLNYKYNENVFLYADKECKNLQDYFTFEDKEKEIIIKNNHNNTFYISTPYSNFKHVLYAAGSNENHSLGCDVQLGLYYGTPLPTVGIDNHYIKVFKYGYYHCFALSMDGNLYVNGKDLASSLQIESSSKFTLENHFHEIGKKEGIENIWVSNFNSTIMLTKTNKLFAAGNNTDGSLSRTMTTSTKVPIEMKPLPLPQYKVKTVSCGYKTSMIILDDGSAYGIGCNSYYETTNRETKDNQLDYYKLNLPENHKVKNVVAGEHYFLLLIEEPNNKIRLYSVGCNENGRAGVEIDGSCNLQKCRGVENLEFKTISSRNLSSAAISRQGRLFTFGNNEVGNLGLGHKFEVRKPTLVDALRNYIVDEVCIAHNHMLVIARNLDGEKKLLSCGINTWGSLCFSDLTKTFDKPEEVGFFKNIKLTPIKISNSRYQSFILNLDSNIQKDISDFQVVCNYCQKPISNLLFLAKKQHKDIISKDDQKVDLEIKEEEKELSKIDCEQMVNLKDKLGKDDKIFICEGCVDKDEEILFLSCLPSPNLKTLYIPDHSEIIKNIENPDENLVVEKDFDQKIKNSTNKFNFDYKCCDCFKLIDGIVNISTENYDLILCLNCIKDHSHKIEFPQLYYSFNNKLRISYFQKNNLPKLVYSSSVYGVSKNVPYSMDVKVGYSYVKKLKQLVKSSTIQDLYKKWCKLKDDQLISLNELKDEFYDKNNNKNGYPIYNVLYDFLKKIDQNKYQNLRSLDEESFKILNDASCSINDRIFELMTITYNMKEKGNFINLAVAQNLNLVSSRARLNIFQERLEKIKVNVNPNDKELNLSRMKSIKFYEKNTLDTNGEFTIFGQLFNKMKKFPISNYRAKNDNRLFVVTLSGEGATDYGGPYRDILSTASEELHSNYLDLFIKSPNHKNEIGSMRDKFIINPGAKSALQLDMYVFIGYLMGYAICSGYLLNLNLHPLIWKLLLNQKVDFTEYETIDKLFYKLLLDLEKTEIKTVKDFEASNDLNYVIQLSDRSELELIQKGKNIQVSLLDKDKFIELARTNRMNEFKIQIDALRFGLINVIPESILSLITWKELEDLSCGKPTLNIDILKQRTEYQSYRSDDKTITKFWTVLDSFTNEERVLYLKYVWGRSRLPDPTIFPFTHVISKLSHSNPDTRLPSATTCYFTLKLPSYSTIEVMTQKLKYVIYNCSEIDADFAVTLTPDI